MSGKAYTMREMKSIVEYITERKAFGEVKGRKLWVDFANTPLTIRTWQSLKETYLKRILPDIHNPYYKLNMDQIRSFKEGCDVEARGKNKLEVVNLDDDSSSNSNAENQVEKEQPSTSHANNGETATGEDITSSKVGSRDRDSVDTVIIPTCYETAEDIQKALESPKSDHGTQNTINLPTEDVQLKVTKSTPTKSIRDLITYSEPLTPMIQDVLNDFSIEDSDSDDVRMEIVEAVIDTEPQEEKQESAIEIIDSEQQVLIETPPIEVLDSEEQITKGRTDQEQDNLEDPDFSQPKVSSLRLKKRKDRYKIDSLKPTDTTEQNRNKKLNGNIPTEPGKPSIPSESLENNSKIPKTNQTKIEGIKDKPIVTILQKSQSISNSADTILPNNQEAFNDSGNNDKQTEKLKSETVKKVKDDNTKNKTRKRATSQDITHSDPKIKKILLNSKSTKAMSDTDTIKKKLSKKSDIEPNFINKKKESKLGENNTGKKIEKELNSYAENEPSTSKVESDTPSQPSQLNPCLKSVSLFAEQFNRDSYLESESEQLPDTSRSKDDDDKKTNVNVKTMNEVVILKSHSESESGNNEVSPKASSMPKPRVTKSQREKVLANVFGFSSGGVSKKRKKSVSHRKLSTHRNLSDSNGESSEWTSESESDGYVSPPRGRRNRLTRKYLKPKSARILSLEEEGGLFVMYGKKIYPLVKDGKILKNYLTYLPESDPEEEESYWKLKYAEEKKRVDELKRLIDQNQAKPLKEKSPILQAKSSRSIYYDKSPGKTVVNKTKGIETRPVPGKDSSPEEYDTKGKTLKITFAKNNQEVHVEGHWSNIHPVLAEVVQIFNKDSEAPKLQKPNGNTDATEIISSTSSEKSVAIAPVDKDIREKIDKMETEIFNEIEKRDQEENTEVKEPTETNVTKRKRASKTKRTASNQSVDQTSSASSSQSPKRQKKDAKEEETLQKDNLNEVQNPAKENSAKSQKSVGKKASKSGQKSAGNKKNETTDQKTKLNTEEPTGEKTAEENKETLSVETGISRVTTRRQTRTPKKDDKEETPAKSTRTSLRSKTAVPVAVSSAKVDEEDDVRYMFPPAQKPTKATKATLGSSKTRDSKRAAETPQIYASPNLSLHSESTQGYQDSDNSPPKPFLRRKRKLSLSTALTKIKHRSSRRKSYPIITHNFSSDSNSSFHIVVRPVNEDSSLKSDAYRTDSYQLLFPQSRNLLRPLEKIDEDSPMENDRQSDASQNTLNILNTFKKTLNIDVNVEFGSSSNGNTDGANSSNVSLPLSPELSIVENLSISKEMLNSIENHPTLNEIQANNVMDKETHNQYSISQVDVSMPLMQQQCNFRQSFPRDITADQIIDQTKRSVISDSFLNKMNTVNIDIPSLSESLDTRLKNLLLESAKKMSVASIELADNNNNGNADVQRKAKSGKRCSTPRKKKDVQKNKLKIADPVVEEEYTESCSYGGRKSCPPAIQLINEENILFQENVETNIDKDTNVNEKKKGRKKKDVIRVKILRPRSKSRKNAEDTTERRDTSLHNNDSGINETESNLSVQGFNDSIDLIHNHSETCLHANECMADSVEFIETASRSIISLNTESLSSHDGGFQKQIEFRDCQEFVPELFCQNAQDCDNVNCVRKHPKMEREETVFHSPLSDTSLITEDLSDERPSSQPSKWYLLSEDETQTANTNLVTRMSSGSSFGANLRQIFPITCAVPDLSTITERSNESRKPTLDSDVSTRQDFDSQSTFDNINCK